MNPYPTYKDSGIEWIGKIPSGWNTIRIKYITSDHRQGYYSSSPYDDNGYRVVRITDINDDHSISIDSSPSYNLEHVDFERFKLEKGDFLFPRTGGVGRFGVFDSKIESIYGSFLIRFRFNHLIKGGLLKYLFESDIYLSQIKSEIHGGVNQNVHVENIKECYIPIISLTEQQQISNYLDHKTQKIDSLIEKTQQKIELLKEQRTSLINHVVTKGLNPDVEMKDSGVEWIGEIPISWEVTQIRFISEMMRGKFSHRPRNDERFYGGDYPFIQTGDIVSSGKFLTNFTQTLNEMGYSVSKEFPINTLVMSISGNIGDVSILKIKSCFPDSIIGFFPQKNTLIEYLFYLFLSLKDEFLKNSTVSTQMNLNVERVSSIRVPITSIQEQQQIVDYLDEQTQKIDTTIEKETQRIELLKEYRQSLISQVVTGKIDIHDEVLV